MGVFTVATVAMEVAYDKKTNLQKYLSFVKEAAGKGVKLIAFPEQSLQGYLTNLFAYDLESVKYQHENAETVPGGAYVQEIVKAAKSYGMYIEFGMTERDGERPDVLYNASVLVGPEGYVGTYRKVHQPGEEKQIYTPGKGFPVFHTAIGRIGMLICYDKMFPESVRELALKGVDIAIMPTAWPLSAVGGDPETDVMGYYYNLFDTVRAVENQCWFISSNMCGKHGVHEFYGHSQIVAPNGYIQKKCGTVEGIVYHDIDLPGSIVAARSTEVLGLNLLKDRHPEAYGKIASQYSVETTNETTNY
ncbi:MAG: carbon-nitrogen hydrolase family protein [Planctomycetota bacterium]|jgi:predicted amidohydrolase|nr:carbon-nitrogen hydrolase family protein [Planctomycetota bacterium]